MKLCHDRLMRPARIGSLLLPMALTLGLLSPGANGDDPPPYLRSIHRHTTLTSTVPANGDVNPYAINVAPVSAGNIHKDDVLVDNFNNDNNLQGLGTTIVDYSPSAKTMRLFASIPRRLASCPGGVGLTTAMTMLKSGWVIVGSLPGNDGTTATKGQGCLIVLDSHGNVARTITSPDINGPWGNMAVVDDGDVATLFVSNTGSGLGAATDNSPVVNKATVVRLKLNISPGNPPVVTNETVICYGFGEQADKGVFIVGPTGLVLGGNGVLYVSDAIGNRVAAIPDGLWRSA